jgi:hypothetical protein
VPEVADPAVLQGHAFRLDRRIELGPGGHRAVQGLRGGAAAVFDQHLEQREEELLVGRHSAPGAGEAFLLAFARSLALGEAAQAGAGSLVVGGTHEGLLGPRDTGATGLLFC